MNFVVPGATMNPCCLGVEVDVDARCCKVVL